MAPDVDDGGEVDRGLDGVYDAVVCEVVDGEYLLECECGRVELVEAVVGGEDEEVEDGVEAARVGEVARAVALAW